MYLTSLLHELAVGDDVDEAVAEPGFTGRAEGRVGDPDVARGELVTMGGGGGRVAVFRIGRSFGVPPVRFGRDSSLPNMGYWSPETEIYLNPGDGKPEGVRFPREFPFGSSPL